MADKRIKVHIKGTMTISLNHTLDAWESDLSILQGLDSPVKDEIIASMVSTGEMNGQYSLDDLLAGATVHLDEGITIG